MLALLLLLLLGPPPAAAATWHPPTPGGVATPFASGPDPYARGQHRGADLAARPGERVDAPCAGRVTYAGRVPGHGRGVTLRCGALVATVLDLAATSPARGSHVAKGERIGVAAGPTVHLGARRASGRHAYLDPEDLLDGRAAPLGPAPAPATRRDRPRPEGWRPPPRPAAAPREVPVLAWAGLALAASAAPLGVGAARRRRGRRETRLAAQPAR